MGETDSSWDPMIEAYQRPDFNSYGPKSSSKQSSEENLCLFVSGFPSTVTSHAVRNLLSEAGQIQYVKTVPDRKRWNYIIAYVYAATHRDALAIIGRFNNFPFLNSTLRIGFTAGKKPLRDTESPSNIDSVVDTRGSLSGLNQTLSDVESLGARSGKADVMDFQRLGPQQRLPMGRSKLLVTLASDDVKTTIDHGVGRKNHSPSFAVADRRSTRSYEMDATDGDELQSKYCDQLKELSMSTVRQKDGEDKMKTKGLQSVSSSEHQVDNAFSAFNHGSVSSAKKYPELCAFCQTPGQLFCSVCKTPYCSPICQRNDWPRHKNVCQSKPLKSDSVMNFADFDNEFAVGVDVDELSKALEINLPDGKKFGAMSTNLKVLDSTLPTDAFIEVILATSPVSPSEIWVVEEKNSQLMDNIKKSLAKRYSGLHQSAHRSTVPLMLNDYCVCLFSVDGCWYRTRIESVNRDGTFDVRYIDYGNMETVPLSRIDVLEEEFCTVPALAVCCRLAGLVPADGSGVWSKRALKLCSELLPVSQVLKVKCIQKTGNIHSIVLVNSAGRHISDEFIEAGVAKHLSKSSLDQSNRETVEEKERISPAISKDEQPVISLSPLPLSPSGSEVVKEIVVNTPHGMPTAAKHLFRGAKVLVKVLNIVSPTQFWVHLLSVSSDLEKLPELEASMKEHYEKKSSQKGLSLTARMLYAAKCSSGSEKWLRVHVLNFDRSGIDAFLLDYGVCQAMSLVGLISLEGQFLTLPFQAVQCTLAGIRPKAGAKAWTQGTVNYLQRLISQTTNIEHLEAAVCKMDGSSVHLELMLPSGLTVNNLLVKYGMAEYVPDIQPGFFVLSRNIFSGGKQEVSEMSPLSLQISPGGQSTGGEPVEGLLKPLEKPMVRLPASAATPKLRDLMRNPLVKDNIYEVIVTDATHFFGFYVQVVTVEKATLLQSLEERINEIYCDYSGSFRPRVGDVVAARFSVDKKWYRGLIKEVTSPDSALVMFLDYGNCDNVSVKFISPLDASLLAVPVFAYRCTLLEPVGVVFVQPWNPEFLLPLSATFQMKVLLAKENVLVVDLFSKDRNISWKDKLLRDGVIQLKSASVADLSKPRSSPSAGHSISSSPGDKSACSVAGHRPKFEIGSAVCVVHINSVTDFYVHVEDKDLEKAFQGLMQRLKDECGFKCALSSYVPKGPGEVVAASYDHVWYRAKVLQIVSSTACRMEFVDFGNVDIVACSCLRPLPLSCQLDVLAEMAVPCCLFNLSTSPKGGSGDCVDAESSKWFRNLCLEKQFIVTGSCNLVSNRYAIDLRSTEMTSVRDCYLKMSSDHRVSPLAENAASGKLLADKCPVTELAGSSSLEQKPRAPLGSFPQRPSDKRVHFANDVKLPNLQSSGNQLRPTGSMPSGFRSTANSQSEFRSRGSHQFGSRPNGSRQSGPRSTGSNWSGQNQHVINGTAPRSFQNSWPQFTESKRPESKFRESNHSGPRVFNDCHADTLIAEKKYLGSEVSEKHYFGPKMTENNELGSKVTSGNHLASKVTEMNHTGPKFNNDDSHQENKAGNTVTCGQTKESLAELNVKEQPLKQVPSIQSSDGVAEAEKRKHLQTSEVQTSNSRPCQRLPIVNQTVSIVHINSPSDFYIQLLDDESKEQMGNFLAEFHQCAIALNAIPYSNGRVGDTVAGLFDNLWFRAEVIELLPGNRVRLFFVDYGNVSVVECRNIRSTMPKVLLSRPWLAIHCAIEGLVGNETDGEWGKDAIAWFRQRFENDTCTVKMVIPSKVNQPCVVDLVGSQSKVSIKDQLISNRFGKIVTPKLAEKTSLLEVSSTRPQSSEGVCLIDLKAPESLENLLVPQYTSSAILLPHLGKTGAMDMSNQKADYMTCVVPESEKSKHLQSSERLEEVVSTNNSPCQRLPIVNQSVSIVHINSPSDFYIQLLDDESKEQMEKFLAEFHQCALALNSTPYSNGKVGDIVAGLFDNCWFRAEVIEFLPGDKARLFFVDFGNISVVEYKDIRNTMPKALLSRPWLAIHCAIEGLVGNESDGEWGKDAIAWFRQRFENDTCTVKMVILSNMNQPCVVDLVGSQSKESIKDQIISNRFGKTVSPKLAEKTSLLEVSSTRPQSSEGVCLIDLKTPESLEKLEPQSTSSTVLLPHLGRAGAVDMSNQTADYSSSELAVTDKSNRLQTSERPDEVVSTNNSPCQRLPIVNQSVSIVHINSPSDFYIQLLDDESKEQMEKFLAEFHQCALALNATPYSNGKVGDIVAGLFDNCWFRAEVIEFLPGDKARLFFVDFGNISVVECRNIRSTMPKVLLSRPWLAIHCAIDGLIGNETNGEWGKDAIAWFRQRFENDTCTVKMVIPSNMNQPCVVDLVGSQSQESIKDQIISNRFGKTVSPKLAEKTSLFQVSSTRPQSSEGVCLIDLKTLESHENLLVPQSTSSTVLMPHLGKAGAVDMSNQKADYMTSVVAESEKSKHLQSSERPDEVVSTNNSPCQRLPIVNQSVSIVHINSPSDFYIQLLDDESKEQMEKFLAEFHQCALALNSTPYSNGRMGDTVAGLFDNCWFRAEVVEFLPGDKARLFFVDFGNISVVEYKDIRNTMPKALLSRPWLAIHCAIDGLIGNETNGEWGKDAIAWFRQRFENDTCTVKMVIPSKVNQPCVVDLVGSQSKESIKDQLISNRFGKIVTPKLAEKTSLFQVSSTRPQSSEGVCLIDLKTLESHENLLVPQSTSSTVLMPHLGKAGAVDMSNQKADYMTSVVAESEKSKHLQSSERPDEVVSTNNSPCQRLPIVNQSVSIVHINSPSDFYIQLLDDESKEQMEKFLAEFHQCALALNSTPYSNGRMGDTVAGLFDNCWFRAEVIEFLPGDKARLFFVDFGNISVVEYKDIRNTMPKALLSRPWLAIHCAIDRLIGNETNGEWGKDAIAWFRQRFENDTCTVKMVIPSKVNQPCVVDLVGSQSQESIKDQLISKRFGKAVSPKLAEETIRLNTELNSTLAITTDNTDGMGRKVVKVDDDVTNVPQKDIVSPPPVPCDANVKVIYANKPSEFFVQSADEAVQISIAQLCVDLSTVCSNSTCGSYRPSAVGEYVAALFDDMWFRAQVLTILPQNEFELFFVDFGNVDTIGASNIRALPAKFVSIMPRQAISCGLLRVAGADIAGKWSDDSCAWFKAYCENFDFHVQAVVLDECGKCLIDMVRKGDQHSVAEQLLLSSRAVDLTIQTNLLCDSNHFNNEKTNTLATSLSCDANAGSVTAIRDQAEMQHTIAVTAANPVHNTNTRDLCSVAQELSGTQLTPVRDQSASIATSAERLVSSYTNQPIASADLKTPVNNIAPSVDPLGIPVVKPGSFTIKCGDVVTIVHVNSPSDFYVQLQTLQHEFVELLNSLNKWCASSASGAKPYRPTRIGDIVAANFEGIWYRAEVLNISQDSKFQLRFIDYGNVDVTDLLDIRCLPVELINALPRQAMPCTISGVVPIETDGCWSPEAVGWFRENTENVSSFVIRSSSLTDEGKYSVDVCKVLPNGNQEFNLCDRLISLKFGRSCESAVSGNCQSNLISGIKSNGQSYDHSVVAQSSTQSIARLNDQSSGQSTGQLSDGTLPKNSLGDRVQQEVGCSRSVFKFCDLPELRLSSDVTVEVTLPTNPGSFWCQDLLQMADMINRFQFQESPPPASASSCPPKVVSEKNEVCLGFHEKYGEWYRVVVKDVRQDCLAVRFMDYGDETTLPFDHVRPLPAELRSFPPLAFHCSLAGISAVGGGWTEQAKAVFHSLVTSQILSASIRSHDAKADDYTVILKVQALGQLVGDELVTAGVASHV